MRALTTIPLSILLLAGCSDEANPGGGTDGGSDTGSPIDSSMSDSATDSSDGNAPSDGGAESSLDSGDASPLACKATPAQVAALKAKVKHIVVIYQENWSYDGLWGKMPGTENADVANQATITQIQADPTTGAPTTAYASLPQPINAAGAPDPAFNGVTLANQLYDLTTYHPGTDTTGDIIHRFWTNKAQIGSGATANTLMVAWSDNPGLVMSYYDGSTTPLGAIAKSYTVSDHFFQAAYGGSFLNHQFLIAAAPGTYGDTAAASLVGDGHVIPGAVTDAGQGRATIQDTAVLMCATGCAPVADGKYYAVNTIQPVTPPNSGSTTVLPLQTNTTIGDRLEDATPAHSWAWFSGGWDYANGVADAGEAGAPGNFQFHHQAFNYFARWASGTERTTHLKDETALDAILADAPTADANLPEVSFVKFYGDYNEHPGYATLLAGEQHAATLINTLLATAGVKDDTLVVVTFDEFGGRWDHVTPPARDFWGPGTRIPATIIGAMVKRGDGTTPAVDSCSYDTTAILKLIEQRFDLMAINSVDGNQNDLATNIVP